MSHPQKCSYCKTCTDNLKQCSRCKRSYYCSKECQVYHWKAIHSINCDKWEDSEKKEKKTHTLEEEEEDIVTSPDCEYCGRELDKKTMVRCYCDEVFYCSTHCQNYDLCIHREKKMGHTFHCTFMKPGSKCAKIYKKKSKVDIPKTMED